MFNLKSMRKTKLTLALSAVLAGGLMSVPAHAVQLTEDGLGDAAIFQYFTAKGGWQTFIRLINTSNDAIVVKVRFREAANSRELRDFLVALSPNDMWSAWTDKAAYEGKPGIRTNDTSCIFDLPNTGSTTFNTINGHLKGVAFSTDAFTNSSGTDYSDQSTASTDARLAEGYIEVIGVASYGSNSDFARAVTHNQSTGVPENCSEGMNLFRNSPFIGTNAGFNVGNVLAANAQLISVDSGEGVGYDPVILANFQNGSLRQETLLRLNAGGSGQGQWPTLDSADPHSLMLTANGTAISSVWDVDGNGDSSFGSDDVARQQLLANGSLASRDVVAGDLNGDGDTQDTITSVIDTAGVTIASNVSESDLPALVVAALTATGKYRISALGVGSTDSVTIVTAGTPLAAAPAANAVVPFVAATSTLRASATAPVRLTNIAHENDGTADNAVRGGIDAVSAVLARRSVINEWAASPTPTGVIKDFYTQWVVTFPTKHYYVDLQDDPNADDRFAPTLVDPRDAPTDLNDAFAPFSFEFDTANGTGNAVGQSCESYDMVLWDREESMLGFSSPADYNPSRMCNEVNVLSFTDAYATKGLNSSFGSVVPEEKLPPNAMASSFTRAQRGWARMTFTGTGSNTGLTAASAYASAIPSLLAGLTNIDPSDNAALVRYQGLPVVGFALSSYITGSATTNHNTTNTHKYERDIEVVEPAVGGVNATNAAKDTGLVNGDDLDGDNVVQFNNGARDVNP